LWRIATNWSENSGANVNQLMVAIQRNNPQAFINNNINLLKRGAILRMPSAEDIAAISASAARAEVLEQAQLFAGGQAAPTVAQSIAPAVETPLVDVASDMSSASPADEPVDETAQLEIVPPSAESAADSAYGAEDSAEGSSASTAVVSLQEELARKEEALITEQQTNEYLQQRIRELESQTASPDNAAIEIEDQELADMESRLRDQRQAKEQAATASAPVPVVQTSSSGAEQAWYSRWTTWLIAALVLVAAAVGWIRSRRGEEVLDLSIAAGSGKDDTVRGIKDDAEEILKVLEPADRSGATASSKDKGTNGSEPGSDIDKSAADPDGSDAAEQPIKPASQFSAARRIDHEEAHVLDEDSADPEVRLDLARAYISMGDREAARAILGEVIEHGDEAQQAEAKAMLGGL
jgi:pilus assembly protein FimV